MLKSFLSIGLATFDCSPRLPLRSSGLTRGDLLRVTEELGGLTLVDGPRVVRRAYVFKDGSWVGWFSLGIVMKKPRMRSDVSTL